MGKVKTSVKLLEENNEKILHLVWLMWKDRPHLRFGQLLDNYAFNKTSSMFYQEDDETKLQLERNVEKLNLKRDKNETETEDTSKVDTI